MIADEIAKVEINFHYRQRTLLNDEQKVMHKVSLVVTSHSLHGHVGQPPLKLLARLKDGHSWHNGLLQQLQ